MLNAENVSDAKLKENMQYIKLGKLSSANTKRTVRGEGYFPVKDYWGCDVPLDGVAFSQLD